MHCVDYWDPGHNSTTRQDILSDFIILGGFELVGMNYTLITHYYSYVLVPYPEVVQFNSSWHKSNNNTHIVFANFHPSSKGGICRPHVRDTSCTHCLDSVCPFIFLFPRPVWLTSNSVTSINTLSWPLFCLTTLLYRRFVIKLSP